MSLSNFKINDTVYRVSGFLALAIGTCLGIYFTGVHSSNELRNKINVFAQKSCKAQIAPNSTTRKFNDLIESIIEVRTDTRDIALENVKAAKIRGDKIAEREFKEEARINQVAIDRYQGNKIIIPTINDCKAPILK